MARQKWLLSLRILWLVLGILHFLSVQHAECLCSPSESQALLDLKGNNQSTAFSSWRNGSDCCRGWVGVSCDITATHVVALNLTGQLQLRSQLGSRNISKSICRLFELRIVDISFQIGVGENVQGNIPGCFWNMSAMQYLSISAMGGGKIHVNSLLSGKVCSLRNLTHLDIGGISFEGGVAPDCLWGMNQLNLLNLTSVFQIGSQSLVAPVCNLTNLTHLALTANVNYMSVTLLYPPPIPSCIWNMTILESLSLSGFMQPSKMSLGICNIAGLIHLSLSDNGLYGDVPSCIWDLTRLERLILTYGRASFTPWRASISSDICNLKNLYHLDLELSYVHGYVPDCLWNMSRLEVLKVIPSQFSRKPRDEPQIWHLPGSFSSQMCSLSKLRELEVSSNALSGVLPACIWNNMTQLQHLDLSGSDLSDMEDPIATEVFAPSLVTLSLRSTNFRSASLEAIGNASTLAELDISGNKITSLPDGIQGLSRLTILYADFNQITSLPAGMSNMSQLMLLDMSNNFISYLPESLFNSSRLFYLDFSYNHLREISMVVSQRSFQLLFSQNSIQKVAISGSNVTIYTLALSSNLIDDTQLVLSLSDSTIKSVDLSSNFIKTISPHLLREISVQGLVLSENPIENLSGLCHLKLGLGDLELYIAGLTGVASDMSSILASMECLAPNISTLELSNNSISSHQIALIGRFFQHLDSLYLWNSSISGDFTVLMSNLFGNHTQLSNLVLSKNDISGNLSWFEFPGAALNLNGLDVSGNQLTGELPRSLLSPSLPGGWYLSVLDLNVSNNRLGGLVPEPQGGVWILDLSSNLFEGPLPSFSMSTISTLLLSNNRFVGHIPAGLGRAGLGVLDLSHNKLSGEIPAFLGSLKGLQVLDLSSNDFSGSLPTALGDLWGLENLRVQNNSLHGPIPASIGSTGSLISFRASRNRFEGPAPSSLGNCVRLLLIDLSHNNLSGVLPPSFENLSSSLRVFSVASNRLTGEFPAWIVNANFTALQVLDLSMNNFHGELPDSFLNLFGFINVTTDSKQNTLFTDGIQISVKGLGALQFQYFLKTTTSFDVSNNHFSGPISEELRELRALRYLKLSENNFSGNIPIQLSNLSVLESLDLSRNSLTGEIPPEFGHLNNLAYFNVSYNHLTGEIPTGGQFNTFVDKSFFQNNSGLCGFPLTSCLSHTADAPTQIPPPARHQSWKHRVSQWIALEGVLVGVGTGFGAISLTFFVSRRARNLLYVPRRKVRKVYACDRPYGAYKPKT